MKPLVDAPGAVDAGNRDERGTKEPICAHPGCLVDHSPPVRYFSDQPRVCARISQHSNTHQRQPWPYPIFQPANLLLAQVRALCRRIEHCLRLRPPQPEQTVAFPHTTHRPLSMSLSLHLHPSHHFNKSAVLNALLDVVPALPNSVSKERKRAQP
jgi:hypothetical protein